MLAAPIAVEVLPAASETTPIAVLPYSVACAAVPIAVLSWPDASVDQVSSSQVLPLITVICPPMATALCPLACEPTP